MTCFHRWGLQRERGKYFSNTVLPLFLSQPYFNCRKRPQKRYFLWQNSAIYKNGSNALQQERSVSLHWWLLFLKPFSPLLTQFKANLILKATEQILHQSRNMKASVQNHFGSKSNTPSDSGLWVESMGQNSEDMAVLCIDHEGSGKGHMMVKTDRLPIFLTRICKQIH